MVSPRVLLALVWLLLLPRAALAKKQVYGRRGVERRKPVALNESSSRVAAGEVLADLHTIPHDEALGRSHAVTALPGLPFGYDHPMYAGHVSVFEQTLQNKGSIFYWLVESQHKPEKDPLVIWLNGGPGCSSLEGFLVEHGPLLAVATGFDLELNPYAWNQRANVLYIDQPVGTGYAMAREGKYAQSQEEVNVMFITFLLNWMRVHPRYRRRPLFLAGESYAGRYIPHFAHQILAAGGDLNLQGVMIGNGWTHPIVQSESFPEFSLATGLISRQQKEDYDGVLRQCQEKYREDPYAHETWVVCERLQSGAPAVSGDSKIGEFNMYDVRLYDTTAGGDWPWRTTGEKSYLNRKDVQEALHSPVQSWEECSDAVEDALTHEDMYPTIDEFRTMLPHVRTLVYNGQFDWICNHMGVESFLDRMDFPGKENFTDPSRRAQWVSGSRLAGYVKRGGNLTFLLVLGGSHMVPMDKRPQTYDMLMRFLDGRSFEDILTDGLETEMRTIGAAQAAEAVRASEPTWATAELRFGPLLAIQESSAPVEISRAQVLSLGVLAGLFLYPLAGAACRLLRRRWAAVYSAESYLPMLA